jgi:uncharacterized membrane protein YdcZ (DUF606 family)
MCQLHAWNVRGDSVAVQFAIGLVITWIAVVIEYLVDVGDSPLYERHEAENDADYAWYMWLGGIFGAFLVTAVTVGIPALGAVAFTIIFISTQLVFALAADTFGAFDYPVIPLNEGGVRRFIGAVVAVLAAAAYKVQPPAAWSCLQEGSSGTHGGHQYLKEGARETSRH